MTQKTGYKETASDAVIKSGDRMIGIGAGIAVIFLILGIFIGASGGNLLIISVAPIGVLLMIAGYCKKIAMINAALLILGEEERADRIAKNI